jgi:hypothetical protein
MTPGELLIIYFALGAPFGVYSAFNEYDRTGRVSIVSLTLKFLFWPIFVCLFVGRQVSNNLYDRSKETSRPYEIASETAKLRGDITSAVVFENNNQRRRLMDEFERFAGITAAVCEADRNRKVSTPMILEATGHSAPRLGAKCIFRRNRARLLEHRNRALEDFVFELGQASTNGGPLTIDELTERARRLARRETERMNELRERPLEASRP